MASEDSEKIESWVTLLSDDRDRILGELFMGDPLEVVVVTRSVEVGDSGVGLVMLDAVFEVNSRLDDWW